MKARLVALTVLVAVGLTGCAPGGVSRESEWVPDTIDDALAIAKQFDLEWEVSVLSDGVITASEYESAVDRYDSCMVDHDFVEILPRQLDVVGGLQWYSYFVYEGPELDDEFAEPGRDCENNRSLIETPYVLTGTPRMDPQVLALFKECLIEHDLPVRGDEVAFKDFQGDLDSGAFYNGQHWECLREAAYTVYPDLPGIGA